MTPCYTYKSLASTNLLRSHYYCVYAWFAADNFAAAIQAVGAPQRPDFWRNTHENNRSCRRLGAYRYDRIGSGPDTGTGSDEHRDSCFEGQTVRTNLDPRRNLRQPGGQGGAGRTVAAD